jgi:hypothetical protein
MANLHNRNTGIYNEKMTLYCYFYKKQLNEKVLIDPQSIGYVQFYQLDTTTDQDISLVGQKADSFDPIIPELEIIPGPNEYGYPGDKIVRVEKGVYKIEITVPEDALFQTEETVKLKDRWYDVVDDEGNPMADVENIFEVSPKLYGGISYNPINEIDLSLSVNKTELKKGEKEWLFFQVTDSNGILKNIDRAFFSLASSDGSILKSNIEAVYHRNLELHQFVDTVTLESGLKANYVNINDVPNYPVNIQFKSEDLGIVPANAGDRIFISAERQNQVSYLMPTTYKFAPNRQQLPIFTSSTLSGYESLNEKVAFDIKENDGEYTRFYLPQDIKNIPAEEVAEQISIHLNNYKDTLKNKDKLYYNFSNIGSSLSIRGRETAKGKTNSLYFKHIPQEYFPSDLGANFTLKPGGIKVFNESIISGPSIISGTLTDFKSYDSNPEYLTRVDVSTVTINTYDGSKLKTTTTKEKNTVNHYYFNNSTISTNRLLNIQQNSGQNLVFTLPIVQTGLLTDLTAQTIASSLNTQAVSAKNKVNYSFTSVSGKLKLKTGNTTRSIKLLDVANDAYEKLAGGFAVEEGDDEKFAIVYGTITPPIIDSNAFTSYIPNRKNSVFYLSENGNTFLKYQLPNTSVNKSSITYTASYLQDRLEEYKANNTLYYKFSSVAGKLRIKGEAIKTSSLSLKAPEAIVFAGERLKGELDISEGNILAKYIETPTVIESEDAAYTVYSSLESQRDALGISSYTFSYNAGSILLTGSDTASIIQVNTYSTIAPKLYSSELASFDTAGINASLIISENNDTAIRYNLPSLSLSYTPEHKASTLASNLEAQRGVDVNYYFTSIGSKLILAGTDILTSSITILSSNVTGYSQLKGDFSAFAGTPVVETYNPMANMANSMLKGDFYSATKNIAYKTVFLPTDAFISDTMPLDTEKEYKWILDTYINERRILLETEFSFSE